MQILVNIGHFCANSQNVLITVLYPTQPNHHCESGFIHSPRSDCDYTGEFPLSCPVSNSCLFYKCPLMFGEVTLWQHARKTFKMNGTLVNPGRKRFYVATTNWKEILHR